MEEELTPGEEIVSLANLIEAAPEDPTATLLHAMMTSTFPEQLVKFTLIRVADNTWVVKAESIGFKIWQGVGMTPREALKDAKSKEG